MSFASGTGMGAFLGGCLGVGLTLVALKQGWITIPEPAKSESQTDVSDPNLKLVAQVLDRVDHYSARPPDAKAKRRLVEDMVNAGLARFDPYSRYFNAHDIKELEKRMQGKYGGIGAYVHVDPKTSLPTVTPMVGSPAYKSGMLAGDLILKVDGKSTDGLTLEEVVDLIRGKKGTSVALEVLHEGGRKPVDMKIFRDEIEVESVLGDRRLPDHPSDWEFMYDKDSRIAYVRLIAFQNNSAEQLARVLLRLREQGMRGLVLDLRNNPGGLLTAAVQVANLFLDGGLVVTTVRNPHHEEEVWKTKRELSLLPSAKDCPMVVLLNRYSASASELVSAALQDHGRAVIIGERSYGKGSVQATLKMDDRVSRLKLTTASYYSPHGKNIHRFPNSKDTDEWGVKPDAGSEVKLSDDERMAYLLDRFQRDVYPSGKKPSAVPPPSKKPFVDRVLERALTHLRAQLRKAESKKAA
jgi:carboxyl-terminal processing protease